MPSRLDPFVDVMLREQADQLYLLPDEPVTLVKDGKPRKVSKQPLTDQHIYALLVEVAPPEAADKIDHQRAMVHGQPRHEGFVRDVLDGDLETDTADEVDDAFDDLLPGTGSHVGHRCCNLVK